MTTMDLSILAKNAAARTPILFVSLGGAGQLNPLLAIAKAFQRQCPEYIVTFATSIDLRSTIEGAGLRYLPVWQFSKLPQDMLDQFNSCGIRSVELMTNYVRWTRQDEVFTTPRKVLANWIRQHNPSLVVSDIISEAGTAAALDTGTKYAINSPIPPYNSFPKSLPAVFPPLGSGTSLYKTSLWHRLYDLAAGARYGLGLVREVMPFIKEQEAQGIPGPEVVAKQCAIYLNATSEKLSDPRVRWPRDKLKWIGASLDDDFINLAHPDYFEMAWKLSKEADTEGLYTWMDNAASSGKPIVFISLGTIYRLDEPRVQAMYEALANLPVKVLWKLGKDQQRFLPPGGLDNGDFRIESWIPSLPLILAHPQVKLFVNHGGGNSLHEGLFFGKPMVCIPAWMDCFDFAMRCQDAGAGLAITTAPHLDQHQFQSSVKRVLLDADSEKYAVKAREVATDLRTLGGAPKAANELKAILSENDLIKPLSLPLVEKVLSDEAVFNVITLPVC
jgi:polyene glycosyltransferase